MPRLFRVAATNNDREVLTSTLINGGVEQELIAFITHVVRNAPRSMSKKKRDEYFTALAQVGIKYKTLLPDGKTAVEEVQRHFEQVPRPYGE